MMASLLSDPRNQANVSQTIGLHCRVIGKPGRFPALTKVSLVGACWLLTVLTKPQFMDHIAAKAPGSVWVATREQIANHWAGQFPYDPEEKY